MQLHVPVLETNEKKIINQWQNTVNLPILPLLKFSRMHNKKKYLKSMIIIKFILNLMYRFLPEIDGVHELMQQGLNKRYFNKTMH